MMSNDEEAECSTMETTPLMAMASAADIRRQKVRESVSVVRDGRGRSVDADADADADGISGGIRGTSCGPSSHMRVMAT